MSLELRRDEPLAKYSTFAIGGPARLFAVARDVHDVVEALGLGEPLLVLGKGSNCLFSDEGFDGLVLLIKIDFLDFEGERVSAGAGHSFTHLGVAAARRGLGGLPSGIPGSVGGAVVMNAGAGGIETQQALDWVDVVQPGGHLHRHHDLVFGYRSSPFQTNGEIVVAAGFSLVPGTRNELLKQLAQRKATQPLSEKSVGCIFRNPAGNVAGVLIEQCGLKGLRIGNAQVSEVHGNFIVNRGNATAAQVRELIDQIKERVRVETGVTLEEEVRGIPR